MILQGPSNVTFGPAPVAQVTVTRVIFDLVTHTYSLEYMDPVSRLAKHIEGTMPGALQTSLESQAKSMIETNEGWAAGSSTIVSP